MVVLVDWCLIKNVYLYKYNANVRTSQKHTHLTVQTVNHPNYTQPFQKKSQLTQNNLN